MIEYEMTEKETLIAMLPFYLSGQIDRADAKRVEAWLKEDPDAAQILEKISEERHVNTLANEAHMAPAAGLTRLMDEIAVTPQEKTLKGESSALFGWVQKALFAPLKAAPAELAWAACGLLMLVTIGQSYVLYQGPGSSAQGPAFELASGERHQILSMAVVKFSDGAAMGGIADALDEVGALIIDGPTASGQFTIGFVARDDAPTLEAREKILKEKQDLIVFYALKQSDQGK